MLVVRGCVDGDEDSGDVGDEDDGVNGVDENDYAATPVATIEKFVKILDKHKIQVSVRRANGEDIDGACGQLRHKEKER